MVRFLLITITLISLSLSVFAEEKLQGADEDRARALFTELRCVVCQNQSIDSSDADVAKDLREIVREQIAAGKTNAQVRSFLVARYGEFILLKPSFSWHTALLWGAPILLFLAGGVLAWRTMGGRQPREQSALTEEEEAALNKILDQR